MCTLFTNHNRFHVRFFSFLSNLLSFFLSFFFFFSSSSPFFFFFFLSVCLSFLSFVRSSFLLSLFPSFNKNNLGQHKNLHFQILAFEHGAHRPGHLPVHLRQLSKYGAVLLTWLVSHQKFLCPWEQHILVWLSERFL